MKILVNIKLILLFVSSFIFFESNAQLQKDKAFIDIIEYLIKQESIQDYFDRIDISKDFKLKLIVSDFKENPVLKNSIENNAYFIAPYSDIIKSDAKVFLFPNVLTVSNDSCFFKYEIKNKRNLYIVGEVTYRFNNNGEKVEVFSSTISAQNP